MMNLANTLTLSRLALLPFITLLFFFPYEWAAWLCLLLYGLAALTDFLDGYVARKYNQVTPLGTFLDPVIDKIFIAVLFLLLAGTGRLYGAWIILPVLIIAREFLVSGLREFLGPHNIQLPVRPWAKWKTALQMISIAMLIIGPVVLYMLELGRICLVLATILTLVTGLEYLRAALAHIRKMS
ncbi:MAG: CDP-diacylglycerol--glycerol-3-phosphate 3-phosphatidyltransferase [Alphaproteobacteria bacterium]